MLLFLGRCFHILAAVCHARDRMMTTPVKGAAVNLASQLLSRHRCRHPAITRGIQVWILMAAAAGVNRLNVALSPSIHELFLCTTFVGEQQNQLESEAESWNGDRKRFLN